MPRSGPNCTFQAANLCALICARRFDRAAWTAASSRELHLRIGNATPAIDRDRSLDQLAGFLGRIDRIGAGFFDVWRLREAVYAETDILFHVSGAPPRTIPCAVVARLTCGLLQDLRFYLDPTPLPPNTQGPDA